MALCIAMGAGSVAVHLASEREPAAQWWWMARVMRAAEFLRERDEA